MSTKILCRDICFFILKRYHLKISPDGHSNIMWIFIICSWYGYLIYFTDLLISLHVTNKPRFNHIMSEAPIYKHTQHCSKNLTWTCLKDVTKYTFSQIFPLNYLPCFRDLSSKCLIQLYIFFHFSSNTDLLE